MIGLFRRTRVAIDFAPEQGSPAPIADPKEDMTSRFSNGAFMNGCARIPAGRTWSGTIYFLERAGRRYSSWLGISPGIPFHS